MLDPIFIRLELRFITCLLEKTPLVLQRRKVILLNTFRKNQALS